MGLKLGFNAGGCGGGGGGPIKRHTRHQRHAGAVVEVRIPFFSAKKERLASPLMPIVKPLCTRFVISKYSVLTTTDTSSPCPLRTRLDTPRVSSLFCVRGIFLFWVVEIQLIPSPCKK